MLLLQKKKSKMGPLPC